MIKHPTQSAMMNTPNPISGNNVAPLSFAKTQAVTTLGLLALACLVTPSLAQTSVQPPSTASQPVITDAVKASLLASVVRIDTHAVASAPSAATLGVRRAGTGIVIGPNLVLTIGYLVLEAETLTITTMQSKRLPAVLAGYDHPTGFGLLRTIAPLDSPAIELGDSALIATSEPVLNLGHSEPEPTQLNVVSRKPFAGGWEYLLDQPIYTAPAVNNWNGSALTTLSGKLIGVGSLVMADAGDTPGISGNLFVPINLLKPILADLSKSGKRSNPTQPWFGMTTEWYEGSLYVVRVTPNSPAQSAQLQRGDKITTVAGSPFTSQADFYRLAWTAAPIGKALDMTVERAGQLSSVKLMGIDRNQVMARPAGI